jgi:Fic family protein
MADHHLTQASDRLLVRARPLRPNRASLAQSDDRPSVIGAHAILYDAWLRDALQLSTLCNVHALLSPYNPANAGRVRDQTVVVRLHGLVHYRPPEAPVARAQTSVLMDWLTHAMKSDAHTAFPVELAADFFACLTGAHPFRDGNGGVARAVATWILATCGYGLVRLGDLRSYLYCRVGEFYETLARYQQDGNPAPWHTFFAGAVSGCLSQRPPRGGSSHRK